MKLDNHRIDYNGSYIIKDWKYNKSRNGKSTIDALVQGVGLHFAPSSQNMNKFVHVC